MLIPCLTATRALYYRLDGGVPDRSQWMSRPVEAWDDTTRDPYVAAAQRLVLATSFGGTRWQFVRLKSDRHGTGFTPDPEMWPIEDEEA